MSLLKKFSNEIESRGENVKVSLIGAGQMGQVIVDQLNKITGVDHVSYTHLTLQTNPNE